MSLTHFLDLLCLIWQMLGFTCVTRKNISKKKKKKDFSNAA